MKEEDDPLETRAYTMRLVGVTPADHAWRDYLWATHEIVNRGAKLFGDWLLTLRGGLSHDLINGLPDADQNNARLVLALCWLVIEDRRGAPPTYQVTDPSQALREILTKRSVDPVEITHWEKTCAPTLRASIRDDAVWVNRSAVFDELSQAMGVTREEAWEVQEHFYGDIAPYFRMEIAGDDEDTGGGASEGDYAQKATGWLSAHWGGGVKSDKSHIARLLLQMADADLSACVGSGPDVLFQALEALGKAECQTGTLQGVCAMLGWKGRPSTGRVALTNVATTPSITAAQLTLVQSKLRVDATSNQGKAGRSVPAWVQSFRVQVESQLDAMPYAGNTFRYAVMLDHAARRISALHTWIKIAEARRNKFDQEVAKLDDVPTDARQYLDAFLIRRGETSGAQGELRINRRAIDGWTDVVARWAVPGCDTPEQRIAAARDLQASIEKYGDIQLFEGLATTEAECVWRRDASYMPDILQDYVAARTAQVKQHRYKVPAYRHPDALRHPVFCDFGNSRWGIRYAVHAAYTKNNIAIDLHGVSMDLWTGTQIVPMHPLHWQSKRLAREIMAGAIRTDATVSRLTRLGKGALGAEEGDIGIRELFEKKDWNGRLQAPRDALDRLADYVDAFGWDNHAERLRLRIPWLLSFSASLTAAGPWIEYAAACADNDPARPFVSRNGDYAVKHESNNARQGLSKLILSRLPGLRVLSVDLGHRHAAACAVWQVVNTDEVRCACTEAGMLYAGETAMYCHVPRSPQGTIIYRRIAAEASGETAWARLERQFLIKLPGEDESARMANKQELSCAIGKADVLGARFFNRKCREVDALMSDALRVCVLALRRHGDSARIAYAFTGTNAYLPGGQDQPVTLETRMGMMTDALSLWYDRACGDTRWEDSVAAAAWREHVVPLLGDTPLVALPDNPKARRNAVKTQRNSLARVAITIADDEALRRQFSQLWTARWQEEDDAWRGKTGYLRWLRDWILPRGAEGGDARIRRVGGLSLLRIGTMKGLYQLQKAYHMRPEPDDLRRNIPTSREEGRRGFGQHVLDALEHLRENRVKQLANRIVEAALGLGAEPGHTPGRGPSPRATRCPDDIRFAPCQAIVIENLTQYRPDESRTRRENRQLMAWSARQVAKYLAEHCALHGLYLRQISPAYSSRMDSRTGAPGLRCQDVPVKDFVAPNGRWFREIKEALEAVEKEKATTHQYYLVALWRQWDAGNASWTEMDGLMWQLGDGQAWLRTDDALDSRVTPRPVRLPVAGGDLFVSVDAMSPAAKGLQADINAAANLGLRALTDPDWYGAWWRVPCARETGWPLTERVKGGAADIKQPLITLAPTPKKPNRTLRSEMNLWRDAAPVPLVESTWQPFQEYWQLVADRVIAILRRHTGMDAATTCDHHASMAQGERHEQ